MIRWFSVLRLTLEVVPTDTWAWRLDSRPGPPTLPLRTCPFCALGSLCSADRWEHFWALRQGLARREAWVLKLHGADGAEPAAWSRAPAEKQTLSRTHAYCFHCEIRKDVQAALCEQKSAWDMVLSYDFRDLCKILSRHSRWVFLVGGVYSHGGRAYK